MRYSAKSVSRVLLDGVDITADCVEVEFFRNDSSGWVKLIKRDESGQPIMARMPRTGKPCKHPVYVEKKGVVVLELANAVINPDSGECEGAD